MKNSQQVIFIHKIHKNMELCLCMVHHLGKKKG